MTNKTIARIFILPCLLLTPLAWYGLEEAMVELGRNWRRTGIGSESIPAILIALVILIGLLFTLEYLVTAVRGRGVFLPEWLLWSGTLLYNTAIVFGAVYITFSNLNEVEFSSRFILPALIFLWDLTAIWLSLSALENIREEHRARKATALGADILSSEVSS